ncbi:MAG: hypothetical protein DRJ65_02340 [Acidobacteria bacterium]|nr:MAG: hypothetical protein DRJ65_02340 [Acidobacteriota bacterium]
MTGGSLGLPDGTSVALDPAAFVFNTPVFPCTGHSFPPHGIYPAFIAEFFIGDIADGQVVQIAVDIEGDDGLVAHFDAFGTGYKQAGPNLKCYDVSNPSGHDVSVDFGEGDGDDDPCPWLAIDKVASASGVDVGDQVDFTITVENLSECDATVVRVTETIPTVLADDGSEVPAFTIVAVDPSPTEQLDRLLIWDIGDLVPGESVLFTVTVVFDEPAADGKAVENTACVYFAETDGVICSSAVVAVGAVPGSGIGGPGFWCNQIRFALAGRHNAKFTIEELEGWLARINEGSLVFSELWDTTTLEGARNLLCRPNEAETVADRLARHLLALHFNIAAERVESGRSLGGLCEGSVPLPEDADPAMTIAELVAAAEADILAGVGDEILEFWQEVIDFVNNASSANCKEVLELPKTLSR